MATQKVLKTWLAEYCCKKKYQNCMKCILSPKGRSTIDVSQDINTTRLSLLVLHDIVVSTFNISRFFTAVSVVKDIFDALPSELVTFKLYAKVTTGLKILALFDMLKKGNKLVLPKLNEFFPRTGIDHPKAEKKLAEKLSVAQLRFRKFLLNLITNKAEQVKYFKNGYKQDYGNNFQEKVKDLVLQFIDIIEKTLPLTAIEKLSVVEDGSKLHTEMTGLTSPVANLMLDMLYEKKYLTHEEVLQLLQALESNEQPETDSDSGKIPNGRVTISDEENKKETEPTMPLSNNAVNKRKHVESPTRKLANLKRPRIKDTESVTLINETNEQIEQNVQVYNCTMECSPNQPLNGTNDYILKKPVLPERGRVYKMNFKSSRKAPKFSPSLQDKAETIDKSIDTCSDLLHEKINKMLNKLPVPTDLAAKFADFIKNDPEYCLLEDNKTTETEDRVEACSISQSPTSLFQAGFVEFLKSQGINTIPDMASTEKLRKTPEQVQTVSSSSEQEASAQSTPVTHNHQNALQIKDFQQKTDVDQEISCKCLHKEITLQNNTILLKENQESRCEIGDFCEQDHQSVVIHSNEKCNFKHGINESCRNKSYGSEMSEDPANQRSKSVTVSAGLLDSRTVNEIMRFDKSIRNNNDTGYATAEGANTNLSHIKSPRKNFHNGVITVTKISDISTHDYGHENSCPMFHSPGSIPSDDTSPRSFYSCFDSPQVEKISTVPDGPGFDGVELMCSWQESPLLRKQGNVNDGSSAGSIVDDSDATSDVPPNSPRILPSSYSMEKYDALCGNQNNSLPELTKHLKHPKTKLCVVKLFRKESLDQDGCYHEIYS